MYVVALFAGGRKFPKRRRGSRFVSRAGGRCEFHGSSLPRARELDRVRRVPLPPEADHVLIDGTQPLGWRNRRFSSLFLELSECICRLPGHLHPLLKFLILLTVSRENENCQAEQN